MVITTNVTFTKSKAYTQDFLFEKFIIHSYKFQKLKISSKEILRALEKLVTVFNPSFALSHDRCERNLEKKERKKLTFDWLR